MANEISMIPQRLDLIVDDCLAHAAAALAARNVGINRQYDAGLPEYPMDQSLVTEAVAILLRSAAQRVEPGRGIRVTLRANRNALMFAVKAPGEGVSDAQREALFGGEPKPGTLARARECIKVHGGVVWANGIAGRGITYYFTLPTKHPA